MKFLMIAVVFAAGPAAASTGALEKAAVSADFASDPGLGFYLPELTVPNCGVPFLVAPEPSPAWIAAVKKAYFSYPQGALPPAALAELPAAALQQIHDDAYIYPSKAYKLTVDGQVAYFIENDNSYGLFVNVFSGTGAHIAYGGFDENYDFYWLI